MGILTHIVTVKETWLSDGSAVYSVEIKENEANDTRTCIVFDAVDRDAAFRVADSFCRILNDSRSLLSAAELRNHTYA